MAAKAQSGYNYQEWGIGAGASYQRGYTNIQRQYNEPGFNLNLIYNYNPYLPVEAEIQIGKLSGGGTTANLDPFGRFYVNNYKALIIHADYQLGGAIDYSDSWFLNAVKNFYVGSGIGLVDNDNTVQRTNTIAANGPLTYVFPGTDSSINVDLVFRVGYEFKIFDDYNEPAFAIDLNYIHSIVFDSGLDGYNDNRAEFKHNSEDQYRQFNIGFKYYFGHVTSYTKLIRQFN